MEVGVGSAHQPGHLQGQRGPLQSKGKTVPGAADMALLARLSLFDRMNSGGLDDSGLGAEHSLYGDTRSAQHRRRGQRKGPDALGSEVSYDSPETPQSGHAHEMLAVAGSVTSISTNPSFGSSSFQRPSKEASGLSTSSVLESHAVHGNSAASSNNGSASRASDSTSDSQGSHGQVVYAKANATRARQDIPWDDEPDFYPRPLDDGTGDGLSLAPLPPSRGRIPTGLPPGLGPGPLASWGPLQGSHTGPLITGPHPGDPLRRDFDGPGGLGRPATNPSDYFFSVDEALSGSQHARTTLMIKNIPNKYTQRMLLELLDSRGFRGHYDFFYLPLDFRNRCNLGYAFVNFINAEVTASFFMVFQGTRWEDFNSRKVCNIAYARLQGKAALVDHFRSSRGFHAGGSEEFLPVVFDLPSSGGGGMFAGPQPLLPPQPPPLPHGVYNAGGVANLGAALQVQAQLLQQQILNHELQLQERALRLATKAPVWQGQGPAGAPPPPPQGARQPHQQQQLPRADPGSYPMAQGGGGMGHYVSHSLGPQPPAGPPAHGHDGSGQGHERSVGRAPANKLPTATATATAWPASRDGGALVAHQVAAPPGMSGAGPAGAYGVLLHGGLPVAIPLSGALHPQFGGAAPRSGNAQQPPPLPPSAFSEGMAALPMAVPMSDRPLPPAPLAGDGGQNAQQGGSALNASWGRAPQAPPPLPPGQQPHGQQQPNQPPSHLQQQHSELQQQHQQLQQQLQQLQQQHHNQHLQLMQQQQQPLFPPLPPPPFPEDGSGDDDGGIAGDGRGSRASRASRASLNSRGGSSIEDQIQQLPANPFSTVGAGGGDVADPDCPQSSVDWSARAAGIASGFRSPVGVRGDSPDEELEPRGYVGPIEGGLYGFGSPRASRGGR